MAEYLPPTRRPPEENDDEIGGRPPFDFHQRKVVSYLWKVHHGKMLMCDVFNPNIYSPCHLNIPFLLEMYPRGRGGNTFDIFVYLHWRLEAEALVNVRLIFYGSDRIVLWSETVWRKTVSKDAPLLLPKGPSFHDVHEMQSDFLIDDGYLWVKCTVWKYNGHPELPSVDDRYHAIEIKAVTRMDPRLLVRRKTSLTG